MTIGNVTGDPGWDAVMYVLAAIFGSGGAAKIGSWLVRVNKAFANARTIVDDVNSLKQKSATKDEVADFAKRLADVEENSAVQAMIYMGFLDVNDERILILCEEGKTLFVSPSLLRLIGLTGEEALAGAWRDIIYRDDYEEARVKLDAFIHGHLAASVVKFRFHRQDGGLVPVQVTMVRRRSADGRVKARIVGRVVIDVPHPIKENGDASGREKGH